MGKDVTREIVLTPPPRFAKAISYHMDEREGRRKEGRRVSACALSVPRPPSRM